MAALIAISLKPARRSFYEGESGFYGFCEEYGNWAADFYYRTYDENGFRTPMYSTGQKTKTAAAAYRMGLYREGKLIPRKEAKAKPPLFPEFAGGRRDFGTCACLLKRSARRPMSKGTAAQGASTAKRRLLPRFGGMRPGGITSYGAGLRLLGFKRRGLSNAAGNNAFKFLKVTLEEAGLQGFIKTSPRASVKFLPETGKDIEILTPEEARALFSADWREARADGTRRVSNKLAACTGMRLGELPGLRGEYVFDGYITVAGQYGRYGYGGTKTRKAGNIIVSKLVTRGLPRLKMINGDGYPFPNDGGEKPLGRHAVYNAFFAAREKIGITDAERRKRGLSMRGWRHFLNTAPLMAIVPESRVISVTGHVSKKMNGGHRPRERPARKARTARETRRPPGHAHFDTAKFSEVVEAQEKLLTFESK